jgi:hypothetical protein
MRGAIRNATSNRGKQRAQPGAKGLAQLMQAQRGNGAILSAQGNRIGDGRNGRHLQETWQRLLARLRRIAPLEQSLRQLEGNGRSA